MKTVLIYVNKAAEVGDVDHLKIFADQDVADRWFAEYDPEGVACAYPVIESGERPGASPVSTKTRE